MIDPKAPAEIDFLYKKIEELEKRLKALEKTEWDRREVARLKGKYGRHGTFTE